MGKWDGTGDWWADRREAAAFARALVEADEIGDEHRVIDYFCEPESWKDMYLVWCASGRPDGPGDTRFDELVRRFAEGGGSPEDGGPQHK